MGTFGTCWLKQVKALPLPLGFGGTLTDMVLCGFPSAFSGFDLSSKYVLDARKQRKCWEKTASPGTQGREVFTSDFTSGPLAAAFAAFNFCSLSQNMDEL